MKNFFLIDFYKNINKIQIYYFMKIIKEVMDHTIYQLNMIPQTVNDAFCFVFYVSMFSTGHTSKETISLLREKFLDRLFSLRGH
jgi:hypothetical protein